MRYFLIILGIILIGFYCFRAGQKSVIPITKVDSIVVYKTKVIDSIKIEYRELKKVAKVKKEQVKQALDTIKSDTLVSLINELDSIRVLQISNLDSIIGKQTEVIKLKDSIIINVCYNPVKKKHRVLKIASSIILITLFLLK